MSREIPDAGCGVKSSTPFNYKKGRCVMKFTDQLREQAERRSLSGHTRDLLLGAADRLDKSADVSDDEFGTMLNCAARYALGRQSYIPSLVTGYIIPLIPLLSSKTLWCFDQDIAEQKYCGGYGDPKIDEPMWMKFHAAVRAERARRGEELYKSWRDGDGR